MKPLRRVFRHIRCRRLHAIVSRMHTPLHDLHPAGIRRNKVVSAAEAVRLIHSGDTVATGRFVGIGFAEEIAVALERRICP